MLMSKFLLNVSFDIFVIYFIKELDLSFDINDDNPNKKTNIFQK